MEAFRFLSSIAHEINYLIQFLVRGQSNFWHFDNSNFLKQFRAARFLFQEDFAIDAAISPSCFLEQICRIDSEAKDGKLEYLATGNVTGMIHPSVKIIGSLCVRTGDRKICLLEYLPCSVITGLVLAFLATGPDSSGFSVCLV